MERPIEIAHLLNPAFCGEIIRRCALKYQEEKGQPLPFIFTFLILPFLIDRAIRERIPTKGAPKLHPWVELNQDFKIGLSNKIEQLAPITKEAILFLSKHEIIGFDESGNISVTTTKRHSIVNSDDSKHPHNFYKKAEKLGQWFSTSGGPSVVFALLGIQL